MQDADGGSARIIDSLDAAQRLFAPALLHARDERLHVAHLDGSSRLIGYRIRYSGRGRAVDLSLRAVIADAIALQSSSLLIAHNHPSGDPTPSIADIEATHSLVQLLRSIEVNLRDHLVFGDGRFVSFRERGLL
jgi:DNA repair protein RadC